MFNLVEKTLINQTIRHRLHKHGIPDQDRLRSRNWPQLTRLIHAGCAELKPTSNGELHSGAMCCSPMKSGSASIMLMVIDEYGTDQVRSIMSNVSNKRHILGVAALWCSVVSVSWSKHHFFHSNGNLLQTGTSMKWLISLSCPMLSKWSSSSSLPTG